MGIQTTRASSRPVPRSLLGAAIALVIGACSPSAEPASTTTLLDSPTSIATPSTSKTTAEAAEQDAEPGLVAEPGSRPPDGDPTQDSEIGYRVAPVGEDLLLLQWDSAEIRVPGHTGESVITTAGPIVEVAQVPLYGLVFQTELDEQTIWLDAGKGPTELIVSTSEQRLRLEGAGVNAHDEALVYYQRFEPGSPTATRSSLRSYNIETGEVIEIIETGAWEFGTEFNHLGLTSAASANWQSEGSGGNVSIALDVADQLIFDLIGQGCSDGERTCREYRHSTLIGSRTYAVGPVEGDDSGIVTEMGVYQLDQADGDPLLIASFSWDNGLWYVEDMFGFADTLILSLSDQPDPGGDPLPALVLNLTTREAHTLPTAAFVRPSYLP